MKTNGFVRHHLKIILALGLVFWGILSVSCIDEPDVEYRVDLRLSDSLSKDIGHYDSLTISIALPNGDVISPKVFTGPYLFVASGGVIKDLLIGKNVPAEYVLVIEAYKGGNSAIYHIKVVEKSPEPLKTIEALPVAPNLPKSLSLSDTSLTLGLASSTRRIYATLLPQGAAGIILFESENPLVAEVDEDGIISPKSLGETQLIIQVQGHSQIRATVQVKIIEPPAISRVDFTRPAPVLYVGGPKKMLPVTHEPDSLTPLLEFSSSDTGIITVSANGEAEAKAEGFATVTVTALGSSTIRDTLVVQAKKDVPVIDAGNTLSVGVGEPVHIKVRVTQEFGTLILTWDFDADGMPEGTTTQDTATATHTYAAAGIYTATFIAKDSEGNTDTKNVRIRVGMAGPLVIITSPKQDTIVNTPEFTVRYTSDDRPLTQLFTLREGVATVLTVRDSNANGSDSASVKVTLDTKAPVVRITAPAKGLVTNLPEIDVVWTVDSVAQSKQTKEILTDRQGEFFITRHYTDSAGNHGRDSIAITRDTIPPLAPDFTGGDSATRSRQPVWTWVPGGGGNGTFMLQLDAKPALETRERTFSDSAELNDSSHTLRVRERDAAGNWSAWSSKTITVRTTGPNAPTFNADLTTTTPTNNKQPTWAWVSGGTIGGGAGAFKWSVNTPTPASGEGIATSFTSTEELPDGTYTLTLQERDTLGIWSSPVTHEIRVSTEGVLVEITAPKRGSHTNVKNGVVEVSWSVDGTLQSTTSDTLTREGEWNRIRREYKNVAGNVSFDTVSVFWDTTAPKVAITSPANGAMVKDLIVPVAWTLDDQDQTTKAADTLTGPDGPKTITRTVTDAAGNTGTATVTVTLDRVAPAAPTVSVTPASPTNDQTPTWSWTGSGPFEYRYGTTNPPTTPATPIVSSPFTPAAALVPGTWYFQVRERDAALNWSAWSAVNVLVIDITPNPTMPAARQHVRIVDGAAFKYTSKLTKIVELNFTMGFHHQVGKSIIASSLDRIATTYGTVAFPITVQHFTGDNGGSTMGSIPNFTVTDLLGGQVIVANNVGSFGGTALGSQRQDAIRTAIETNGRGYIGIHGSGDNQSSAWPWFSDTLHPVAYQGHSSRTVAPVYKHLDQAKHLVLQNVLETHTTLAATVPDELDLGGIEKLANNVPVRGMMSEWHQFGRDITRDVEYRDKVVPLLKYDARSLDAGSLPAQYRRQGGNLFTYIYAVGKGLTSFFPSGHDDSELFNPNTGFDGGAGDYDRYLAQLMFYLAGYNASACDASCNGLEVVDENDHQLTGMRYAATGMKSGMGGTDGGVRFYANKVAFTSAKNTTYQAVVADWSGRVVRRIESKGAATHVFDTKHLNPGVYFLRVSIGGRKTQIKRYAIM